MLLRSSHGALSSQGEVEGDGGRWRDTADSCERIHIGTLSDSRKNMAR